MELYTGTKQVMAKKMTKQGYCNYRGWEVPPDEDGTEIGMLVEYLEGGESNHPAHKGYISWTPLVPFQMAYKLNGGLSLSDAVEFGLKKGKGIRRMSWKTNKFVFRQVPADISVKNVVPKMQSLPQKIKDIFSYRQINNSLTHAEINYHNQLALVYPNNRVTAWNASTDDILTNDYEIL
jgi:hypothetical protein